MSAQSLTASPQAATTYTVGLSAPVQRAQNTTLFGSYFFSIFPSEMTNALATNPTWNLEGTAFHASLGLNPGLAPVYRFRNLINGSYLYTINEGEKSDIIANYSATFTLEGTAWYASPVPATGFSALYRFRNLTNGTYLFSAYEAEKDAIVANYAGIFLLEGISYYVRQTAPLELSLLAGSGLIGSANGTGAAASFYSPEGMARDPVTGNIYVADSSNHVIRKITPEGVVTTIAGSAGAFGSADGVGSVARFNSPVGLAWGNNSGLIYISDSGNHTIRYLNPVNGAVVTLTGLAGATGFTDGSFSSARFNTPLGLAIDSGETALWVADRNNNTVRRLSGTVTTVAGTAGLTGSTDATRAAARFNGVRGVALDASLNVYVSESTNRTIRKITPTGVVTTIAGASGVTGTTNGTGVAARFSLPWSIASDGGSNLYVADTYAIRKVTTSGVVTTVVGTSAAGFFKEGLLPSVLSDPNGAHVSGGKLYISTFGEPKIAQINGVP
jgi:hypothetical protein